MRTWPRDASGSYRHLPPGPRASLRAPPVGPGMIRAWFGRESVRRPWRPYSIKQDWLRTETLGRLHVSTTWAQTSAATSSISTDGLEVELTVQNCALARGIWPWVGYSLSLTRNCTSIATAR
jgi:hypothetical protein